MKTNLVLTEEVKQHEKRVGEDFPHYPRRDRRGNKILEKEKNNGY